MPRLMPCLDVDAGRVVKGVQFAGLRDCGDAAAAAAAYGAQGADELVLLDISATAAGRRTCRDTVAAVRAVLPVPLCVGGGVRTLADAAALLEAGADKVAVNSAAVADPALLTRLAQQFGRQCVVLAIDARATAAGFAVTTHGAASTTALQAADWAREAERRGAGEILLTSVDRDGTGRGYDLELLRLVRAAVGIPIVASGGASQPQHLIEALRAGADAVLVASLLHDGVTTVGRLKSAIAAAGIEVRQC